MKKSMKNKRLICGKIQGNNVLRFWKVEDDSLAIEIGDFAIVENMDSYNLVKILGVVISNEQEIMNISNTDYKDMKRMLKEISINDLVKPGKNKEE